MWKRTSWWDVYRSERRTMAGVSGLARRHRHSIICWISAPPPESLEAAMIGLLFRTACP